MNRFFIFALALAIGACGNSQKGKSVSLTGAGATFPLPYYNLAFKNYNDTTGVAVVYGGIGSGGGIRSLKDKTVDFAGSDAYLTDEETAEMPYPVIHIPTCMGAVVMAYNLPEVKELNLTGELIGAMYTGKITRWNDAAIAAANPGVSLPDKAISPVYRSDGSGTTFVFTDYLAKACPGWQEEVGSGKSLKWPAGIAAKGNPGVAGTVSQTEGAIGYVGSEYAFSLNIPVARIQNRAGQFILPDAASISAAASSDIPDDTRTMITDAPGDGAYPISCFTWLLLYREQSYGGRELAKAEALLQMLDWMLQDESQSLTEKVHYAPLPESAREKAGALLRSATYNGKQILE